MKNAELRMKNACPAHSACQPPTEWGRLAGQALITDHPDTLRYRAGALCFTS
ncbi:MAG: hypothetical protein IIA61_05145 [Candidatus Marinimicrobia bacterium]|nr:hypothetical protein [Candidatus Neomarinimicrobiota bacterium]